ncbi:MAG: hypothetical protein LBU98_04550 [Alistipes sp.]|jgi:hypothetical protein|nr:hypothetical protein [Alistipes sp.]
MKRILLVIAATVLSAIGARADEKSDALLNTLARQMAEWGDYRVEFTVSIDANTVAGSYEVSGDSYHVTTPEMDIYCDGATKWEVNLLDREVAIDSVDPADRTVMGNPTRLFDFLDGSYSRRYVGPALIDGAACERIELKETPPAAGTGTATTTDGQTIDLYLSATTGMPVRVGYTIGFMSTEAAIDVVRITPRITLDRSAFGYAPGRYSGYEIIDFRP